MADAAGLQTFNEDGSLQWDASMGVSMQLGSGIFNAAGSVTVAEWADSSYEPWFMLVPTEPVGPVSVSLQASRSGSVLTWNYPYLPPQAVNRQYLKTLVVWGITSK